jgi:transcriptional regulator with XRE-family HTH domain
MKQSDLCSLTGIPKSAISQYIKGSFEPKQERVYIISKALGVSEAWLMGYDVPMERQEEKNVSPDKLALTEGEQMVLDLFRRVPEEQQKIVLEMIRAALGTRG